MIPGLVLALCDLFLLGLLIYRQEYLFFQLVLFSQAWLLLVLLPFHVRGETKVGAGYHKVRGAAIAILIGSFAAGVFMTTDDFWPVASNFNANVSLILTDYADILPVAAAIAMAAAVSATSFLRGHK